MGGASHKYAVRWPTSYKILAVSVQTRVELPCFIVHLEFFSPRQGSLQEIRLSWMRSGHQSESFNQRSRFPKDHSRSRGPILFCKVGSWLLSPHLQPYDMAFLCLDFCFNGDFYEFRNKFQFSFKLSWNWDFSHLRVENTSIFSCTEMAQSGVEVSADSGSWGPRSSPERRPNCRLLSCFMYWTPLVDTSSVGCIKKTIFFVWEMGLGFSFFFGVSWKMRRTCVSHFAQAGAERANRKKCVHFIRKKCGGLEVALVTWHTLVQRNRHENQPSKVQWLLLSEGREATP